MTENVTDPDELLTEIQNTGAMLGRARAEIAIDAIRGDRMVMVGVGRLHPEPAPRLRTQLGLAHQTRDSIPTTELVPLPQRPVHSWRTVDAPGFVEDPADQRRQSSILAGSAAFLATEPRIETAPGDPQGLAHQAHLEGLPVVAAERKPQFFAFAK